MREAPLLDARYACFDVFDTLVARRVTAPSDVFRIIYRRMTRDGILDAARISEDAFVATRRQAERAALVGREECTLQEIWDQISKELPIHADVGCQYEMHAERVVLFPIKAGAETLIQARNAGRQCVLITDTYLPQSFISGILEKEGFLRPEDKFYVSSTFGKTKRSGSLYCLIMEAEQASPSDFEMTGDNFHSDIDVPKKLGWKVHKAVSVKPSNYELSVANQPALPRLARSVLCGAVRSERLKGDQNSLSVLVNAFLGPASMLWAIWVLLQARDRQIESLNFMARDAHLAWICAKAVSKYAGWSIECRYLYASRNSLSLASVTEVQCEQLKWLARPWEQATWAMLLGRLELTDLSDLPSLAKIVKEVGPHTVLQKEQLEAAFATLTSVPVRTRIEHSSQLRREVLLRYFEQEQLLKRAKKSAIVDVGWHLSAQTCLRRIVENSELAGFYLALWEARAPIGEAGSAWSMLGQPTTDAQFDAAPPRVIQNATLTEHLFGLAPHGTVQGYELVDGRIMPVTQNIGSDHTALCIEVCRLIGQYAKEHAEIFLDAFSSPENCVDAFRQLTDVFYSSPPEAALREIAASVSVSTDPDNLVSETLAVPYDLREAISFMLPASVGIQRPSRIWHAGSLAISPPVPRTLMSLRVAFDRIRKDKRYIVH